MKRCSKCKIPKNESEFHRDKKLISGLASQCKTCVGEYGLEHRSRSSKARKENQLRARYNLTLKQVEEMYVTQEGKCAICSAFKSSYSKPGGLVIDHDHSTGAVRKLLCTNCNILLGRVNDSVELLDKAIVYLKAYK